MPVHLALHKAIVRRSVDLVDRAHDHLNEHVETKNVNDIRSAIESFCSLRDCRVYKAATGSSPQIIPWGLERRDHFEELLSTDLKESLLKRSQYYNDHGMIDLNLPFWKSMTERGFACLVLEDTVGAVVATIGLNYTFQLPEVLLLVDNANQGDRIATIIEKLVLEEPEILKNQDSLIKYLDSNIERQFSPLEGLYQWVHDRWTWFYYNFADKSIVNVPRFHLSARIE